MDFKPPIFNKISNSHAIFMAGHKSDHLSDRIAAKIENRTF